MGRHKSRRVQPQRDQRPTRRAGARRTAERHRAQVIPEDPLQFLVLFLLFLLGFPVIQRR